MRFAGREMSIELGIPTRRRSRLLERTNGFGYANASGSLQVVEEIQYIENPSLKQTEAKKIVR